MKIPEYLFTDPSKKQKLNRYQQAIDVCGRYASNMIGHYRYAVKCSFEESLSENSDYIDGMITGIAESFGKDREEVKADLMIRAVKRK